MNSTQNKFKWLTLLVLNLALAIVIIDTTVLNVSVREIVKDLNTNIKDFQWIITTYSLTIASLTITGGRFGDIFGKKKMFLLGAVIFAIGSIISTISQNFSHLLFGWAIMEGIGASLMMPATASITVSTFKGKDRAIAFGVWGGVAGASSIIGPILGGFLTDNASWRFAFLINVIIIAILLTLSFAIKETKIEKDTLKKIDIFGAILSGIGMFFIIFGIIESSAHGWFYEKTPYKIFGQALDFGKFSIVPIALLLGLLFLIWFVFFEIKREKTKKIPLVSMKIFTNKSFTIGVITGAIISLGQMGIIFSIPIFLQSVLNLSALETGLTLLPMSLTILFISPLSIFFTKKIQIRHVVSIGLIINFIAVLVLRNSINTNATIWSFTPGLIIFGFGTALVMSRVTNLTLSSIPENQTGEASGINNTLRQVGQSLGSAIIGAIMISSMISNLTEKVSKSSVLSKPIKEKIIKIIDETGSDVQFMDFSKISENKTDPTKLPENLQKELEITNLEMKKISNESIVSGNKDSLLYGSFFTFLAIIVSFFLPKEIEKHEQNEISGH